jgi:hypothetical protein
MNCHRVSRCEKEIQVYRTHVMAMLGDDCRNEGKFTVIKCDDISDPFETHVDTLESAYERCDLWPFLVRKIEQNETALYFSRDLP